MRSGEEDITLEGREKMLGVGEDDGKKVFLKR